MNRQYSVLILGGGIMQLPAIDAAKEMGWFVIVADGNPKAIGASIADTFLHVDLKDREAMLEAARRYREAGRLDGVFTAGTDFSSTVAYVAERLGLPGIPFETALDATDKGRMRARLSAAGVPCPRFLVLTSAEQALDQAAPLGFPLVVKPVDNMGSRGVRKVSSEAELLESVRTALGLSRTGQVIVEEYIDGPEFSIDALVFDGEITICGFADRHIFFPPYFVEMGHTIPTALTESDQERIVEVFRRGVRALGLTAGAAKGDVKLSPNGPVIGEIAARLSGGYMSGWTFPYASGVSVTAGGLKIAVGLHPGDLSPQKRHVCAERAFISIPGEVQSIQGIDEARKDARVKELFLRIVPGARVVFPANNVEKCGNVIAEAPMRDEAVAAAESAVRKLFVRLVPGDAETKRHLFDSDGAYPPGAFRLECEENITALSTMAEVVNGEADVTAAIEKIRRSSDPVRIVPLPALDRERGTDWHGMRFDDALRRVLRETGAELDDQKDAAALGALFWKAFLKGGIQGGVWLIDTVRDTSWGILSEDAFEEFAR